MRLYHGTNKEFRSFSTEKARILNDNYGGGIAYFTDSLEVAKRYAISMFNRYRGEKRILACDVVIKNLFDVDAPIEASIVRTMFKDRSEAERFARGAGLLKPGVDRVEVISRLMDKDIDTLTGEQVYRGISSGGVASNRARNLIERAGYDGLKYNGPGGAVYLPYKPSSINIVQNYLMDQKNNLYERID